MIELLPWARWAVVVAFALLATVGAIRLPRSGPAGRWVTAAFGTIALASLGGRLEAEFGVMLPNWFTDIRIALVLAFPYLLLRFTASFRDLPRWMEAAAGAATALVMVAVPLALPTGAGWPVPVALAYWALVSMVTVVRLWRAGQGQPTVARRRMRLMSAATAVLTVALLLAARPLDDPTTALAVQLTALVSALAFGLGFAPPRAVRRSWRRPEEEHLQHGTIAVLRAMTVEDVADELLAPTAAIIGAGGAALLDPTGHMIAHVGTVPTDVGDSTQASADASDDRTRQVIALGEGRGDLVVWTTPYAPFFGREEIELLQTMAAVAALALERCELTSEERRQRMATEQAYSEADRARGEAERARGEAEQARGEAERANLAKSEFLSRMSHELRTPLNAILGFGQLLETVDRADDDAQAVDQILKAGWHLLALIDDVLDLARIEAGKLAVSLEPVHAGELIADTLALVRPRADERSIRLSPPRDTCDVYVMTDRQRCRQVLLNLLSNAVKYNHDGGEVDVRCGRVSEATLRISVCDSGRGIDPDRQAQLFEPFERLGAESSQIEGTGLGLALTKQLVEHLGGKIGVESTLGEGSTFWVELPTVEAPSDRDEPVMRQVTPPHLDKRTLLLVEDNLANLRLVEAMLRRRPGISVIPAMQGGLAVELASQHQPDVIVLDLHLPDLPGRDVLNRIKADRRTRDIPVVIASAEARPSHIRQLRDDGAFEYITKPLDLGRFLDTIDAALAQRDTSVRGTLPHTDEQNLSP